MPIVRSPGQVCAESLLEKRLLRKTRLDAFRLPDAAYWAKREVRPDLQAKVKLLTSLLVLIHD